MTTFSPREIVSELDRFIVGQKDAKRAVAIALRNRWRRQQVEGPLKDEIARLPGVGNVNVFGAGQYSMRIWLDPEKMQARDLNAQDVIQALQQQSEQVTAGQLGMPPVPSSQSFQYTIDVVSRFDDPAQFANVVVKTGTNGDLTRVRDVGRVELGAQTYSQVFNLDGKQAAGLAIFQTQSHWISVRTDPVSSLLTRTEPSIRKASISGPAPRLAATSTTAGSTTSPTSLPSSTTSRRWWRRPAGRAPARWSSAAACSASKPRRR